MMDRLEALTQEFVKLRGQVERLRRMESAIPTTPPPAFNTFTLGGNTFVGDSSPIPISLDGQVFTPGAIGAAYSYPNGFGVAFSNFAMRTLSTNAGQDVLLLMIVDGTPNTLLSVAGGYGADLYLSTNVITIASRQAVCFALDVPEGYTTPEIGMISWASQIV